MANEYFQRQHKVFGREIKKFRKFMKAAKKKMIDDKLIKSGEDIDEFELSSDEIIINGENVSPELRSKYLAMYEEYNGEKWMAIKKFQYMNSFYKAQDNEGFLFIDNRKRFFN